MNIFKSFSWKLKGVKVYALVGRSGTGKSFRAGLLAKKYQIDLLIDDGLLIYNEKIIAGKSAKKEDAYMGAIKTALFDNPSHKDDIIAKLKTIKFKKILLIGTSNKMVAKIAERLELPEISTYIQIEDIASKEEIEKAIHSRTKEGKHVIPVPSIEVKRDYAHIFYDSIKVFFSRKKNKKFVEKSVVRPIFNQKDRGAVSISEAALSQMVLHCVDEHSSSIKVKKIIVTQTQQGYNISLFVNVSFGEQLSGNFHNLQKYITESIERLTGIIINEVDITIDQISHK
ncbi:MAG: Asp23/Gls24 family envelope stress response protein [Spirochaetales bacterium]|nr:Asp23/Gls24 family envelope stress response protein [Spirochaetales bacterium]